MQIECPSQRVAKQAAYIQRVQLNNGAIPWFEGGHLDPWDHIEAAMGLSIAGCKVDAAERAYQWLLSEQMDNGAWRAYYFSKENYRHIELHHAAYIAVGVWHHYKIYGELDFLIQFSKCVEKAIDLVSEHQLRSGLIPWAVNEYGIAESSALTTANCSILKSLECAINIAATLKISSSKWRRSYHKLHRALRMHDCYRHRNRLSPV